MRCEGGMMPPAPRDEIACTCASMRAHARSSGGEGAAGHTTCTPSQPVHARCQHTAAATSKQRYQRWYAMSCLGFEFSTQNWTALSSYSCCHQQAAIPALV
eukprot:116570-Chlamydomonas_euryale.AAC.2